MVEYRYELKFVISKYSAELLKRQLKALMKLDKNSISDKYSYDIRSLYFDDDYNSSLYEKLDGIEFRGKYRIRIYNGSSNVIKLECKHKDAEFTYKESCSLTLEQYKLIKEGRYDEIISSNKFLNKFIGNALERNLKPAVLVDYRRTAFTYDVSEVRITIDEDIRSGRYQNDLFDDGYTYPVTADQEVVLEVKCNEFIPSHITAVLSSIPKTRLAVSKFAYCMSKK